MSIGQPHTATIHAFPTRPRGQVTTASAAGKIEAPQQETQARAPALGESWYHQAAIQDAARPRKP